MKLLIFSSRLTLSYLFTLIKHRENNGWEFIFLAANQDAIEEGCKMGMKANNCINWSKDKSEKAFNAAGDYACRYRSAGITNFTEEERTNCN